MQGVRVAYSVAVRQVFYMAATTASVAFVCTLDIEVGSVKGAKSGASEVLALVVFAENKLI